MVLFMWDSVPSQRVIFCLKFVKVTFLKGTKAKKQSSRSCFFFALQEQARACTAGLLRPPRASAVASAFPLHHKQKASLWKPGLHCSSLPLCSKIKDVPSLLFLSTSSFNCQFISFLHMTQPLLSTGQARCAPSWSGSASSHLILWQLTVYTHVSVVPFSATLPSCPDLCHHNRNDFWWSQADIFTSTVSSRLPWGRCKGPLTHPSTGLQVKARIASRINMINAGHHLKHAIPTLKQLFSEIW